MDTRSSQATAALCRSLCSSMPAMPAFCAAIWIVRRMFLGSTADPMTSSSTPMTSTAISVSSTVETSRAPNGFVNGSAHKHDGDAVPGCHSAEVAARKVSTV